tara:strand:+ start:275 stop:673 length:399 start_codon:yes stop_codon:yes gene_type:complete
MEIIRINYQDADLVYEFLSYCDESLKTFRYFDKRKAEDVLKDHIVTLLAMYEGRPIGYAHLDKDGEKIWLGICIADKYRGLGLGTKLMKELMEYRPKGKPILLTVDGDNKAAIKLYAKHGFLEKTLIMENSL